MGLGDDRDKPAPSPLRLRLATAVHRPRAGSAATVDASPPVTVRPPLPDSPLVSVVVPVYDGEDHLSECLDSLLRQSYRRIQLVVVDDGSTDRSAQIARDYADRDDRVVLVGQAHAGLGAARNTGLDRCDGELITFADADDTVAQHAYRRMVRTLQQSGSDFVVGAVVRSRRGSHRMRRWVRLLHERRRIGVRIDDVPELLGNVMAWSKLFRRDFLERLDLRFPEGILYEDQIPMTRAYLEARAFDVIPEVVYRWRVRADGNSITQRKAELSNLLDRMVVQREIAELLRRSAQPVVERRWYLKTFRGDVPSYAKASVAAGDEYWEAFRQGVLELKAGAPADLDEQLPLPTRLAAWLIEHDHRQALARLVGGSLKVRDVAVGLQHGQPHAVVDLGPDPPSIPDDLLRLRPVDVVMRSRLTGLDWVEGGRLTLRCIVSVSHPGVLGAPLRHHIDLVRVDAAGGTPPRVLGEAPRTAGSVGSTDWYAVVASVDVRALVEATGQAPHGSWAVHPGASSGAMAVESRLHHRSGRLAVAGLRPEIVCGALVRVGWSEVNGIVVDVRNRYASLVRAETDAGGLELEVRVRGLRRPDRIYVGETAVPVAVLEPSREGTLRLQVPTDDLPRSGLVRVASARVSAPLLALATKPPVLEHDGAVKLDRRGRVLLDTPRKPDDRGAGEDVLLQTSP